MRVIPRGSVTGWNRISLAACAAFVGSGWLFLRAGTVPLVTTTDREWAGEPIEELAIPGFRTDAWFLPDDSLLGFAPIEAGPFLMGTDPKLDSAGFDIEWWVPEGGRGTLELPLFFIGRYEVTVAQYRAFLAATSHPSDPAALSSPPDHPVSSVSWTDALAYAGWLEGELVNSASTPPRLAALLADGWHVTLPTEAEWEKAARGADGRTFPWGEEARRDRATFEAAGTTAVGRLACPECPYGLADMAGNVWEWTRSPYQPYPYDDADDRTGLDAEALWVMRGGSFGDPGSYVRAANRGGADPGARRPFIGFRLAISRR